MRAVVLVFALLLGACDGPEIKVCEDYILAKLRSPSTYKRIEVDGINVPYENPDRYHLSITYDAANAYGTPVRETQSCVFGLKGGKPDTSKYYDFDTDLQGNGKTAEQVEAAANAAMEAANAALNNAIN